MSRSKEYIAIKNFLHNECGLSKEGVKEIAEQAIRDAAVTEARRYLQSLGPDFVEKAVGQVLTKEINNTGWHNSFRKEIIDKASRFIADKMQVSVKQ